MSLILISINLNGQNNTVEMLLDMGTRYDYGHSIALQNDGKVVVSGNAWGSPFIVRFDTTGGLDPAFGKDGKLIASWNSGRNPGDGEIQIQADGKMVLGTSYYNGNDADFIIARYLRDGSHDESFGNQGKVITKLGTWDDWCSCLTIQSDGKIVAGGEMTSKKNNKDYSIGYWDADLSTPLSEIPTFLHYLTEH